MSRIWQRQKEVILLKIKCLKILKQQGYCIYKHFSTWVSPELENICALKFLKENPSLY